MRHNGGKALSIYNVSSLFGTAGAKAATIGNGVSGFMKTGNWPVDETVFVGATIDDACTESITAKYIQPQPTGAAGSTTTTIVLQLTPGNGEEIRVTSDLSAKSIKVVLAISFYACNTFTVILLV